MALGKWGFGSTERGSGGGWTGNQPQDAHHGEVTDVTSKVLPDGSGHNHWNSLEHG